MDLGQYLDELTDGDGPLARSGHEHLSSPQPEDMAQVQRTWPGIPAERRAELIGILAELAEDTVELDFSDVLRMAIGDPCAAVRGAAARGLWECEDRTLIPPLCRLLSSDPEPQVRAAAAMALRPFAERAGAGELIDRDCARLRSALMGALARPGEEAEVIRRALEAAGSLDGEDVAAAIEEAAGAPEPGLRQSALYAMGASGRPGWLPRLVRALGDPEPAMRYEAAGALGRMGGPGAAERLAPLLSDADAQVREAAAEALGMVGDQRARDALARCAEGEDGPLGDAARAALAAARFEEDPLGLRFET